MKTVYGPVPSARFGRSLGRADAVLIFKAKPRSYRDLPIRLGEFSVVRRHGPSGQDDAHIFCRPDQLKDEIAGLIGFVHETYSKHGSAYEVELSARPEKAAGAPKTLESAKLITKEVFAERILKDVLAEKGIAYKLNEAKGAFYGPKAVFRIKGAVGGRLKRGTILIDVQMPERLDLAYEGGDGQKHRPIVIHRAI